jgi:hypothetical protein
MRRRRFGRRRALRSEVADAVVADEVIEDVAVDELPVDEPVADGVADAVDAAVVDEPGVDDVAPEVVEPPMRRRRFGRRRALRSEVADAVVADEVVEKATLDGPVVEQITAEVAVDEAVADEVAPEVEGPPMRRRRFGRRRAPEPEVADSVVENAFVDDVVADDVLDGLAVDEQVGAPIATEPALDAEARDVADAETVAPVADVEPKTARANPTDKLAARVDASVDALMVFIPEALDARKVAEPPVTIKESAADAPVEQAIARVDASVEALMRLLPGSTQQEKVIEEPPPVDEGRVEQAPAEEAPAEEAPAEEAPAEEAPVDEPPVEEAIARVDASVEALMRLLPGTVELDPTEAPDVEPVAESPMEEPAAEAEQVVAVDAEAEIAKPRRVWRAAKPARVEPSHPELEEEVAVDSPIPADTAVESREPEVVAGPEPEFVPEPVAALAGAEEQPEPSQRRRRRFRAAKPARVEPPHPEPEEEVAVDGPIPADTAVESREPEVVAGPEPEFVPEPVAALAGAEEQPEPSQRRRRRFRAAKRAAPEQVDIEVDIAASAALFDVTTIPEMAPAAVDDTEDEAVASAEEPAVVTQMLEFQAERGETGAPPVEEPRRRRRLGRHAKPDDAPAPLPKSAWPPAPTLAGVPEPTPEPAPAESAERIVDFSRPPVSGTVVGGVVVPEGDREAPAARVVIVPEIVDEPVGRWATPPTAHPIVDRDADGPRVSEVEVVEARQPEPQPTFDLPADTRAIRVKTVKVHGKRRWVVDVLMKQPDADDDRK